jgi:hypothetical protein
MEFETLPNLLMIGAAKAGTTSLHSYLAQHPEVSMSQPKELRYFWRDDWHERRDWYAGHFRPGAIVRGESTPGYSMWPVHNHVPERAAQLVPQAKIIYVVRDPVERIVSHYCQRLADGFRTPLQAYIESIDLPENALVCPSRYHTQISRWLMWFDVSQVMVVDYEDLKVRRAAAVEQILGFLGLEMSEQLDLDTELNPSAEKYAPTAGGRIAAQVGLWHLSARLPEPIKAPVRPALRTLMFRRLDPSVTLDATSRRRLENHLRPEADAFRERVDRSFPSWSV